MTDILPLAQYWAWRLSGVKATEVTSLGAHTHLWRPAERRYSELARRHGWAARFPPMRHAWDTLAEFGVPCERHIVSAHRTPLWLAEFAAKAEERGVQVVIAGAGGAAHLPGMAAAQTILPVLGVPVQSHALSGMDSLLSIVQMPAGIPVATVSIGGARNAGLLAARIVGTSDDELGRAVRERMNDFQVTLRDQAHAKGASLRDDVAKGL